MKVIGYDPGISVKSAWNLSARVKSTSSVDDMMTKVDFVSLHVPFMPATENIINADRLSKMKKGGVLMNFARDGIADDTAVLESLDNGHLKTYVTDFPNAELIKHDSVITLPHLGASTQQAEENCAVMVAEQIKDYLENGNIINSVNFPEVNLPKVTDFRLSVVNANMPDMVAKISHILGENDVNIHHMVNESRGDVAYTLLDVNKALDDSVVEKINQIDGVLAVRAL